MAAAIAAKENSPSLSVTVCEKNDRVGKKLLATGNGRCNLSNTSDSPEHFHGSFDAAGLISKNAAPEELFSRLGMPTTADTQGRVYPYSNSASTVVNTLRSAMARLGVEEVCGFTAADYTGKPGAYRVTSAEGDTITAKRIIIAAGGYAAPVYGTDGAMMRLLREKGYRTAKLCPAVAPLRTAPESLKGLKGVRARCTVTALSGEKKLRTEQGEIQFTENSLSGICVFNLAYLYGEYPETLCISVDFASDMDKTTLIRCLEQMAELDPEAEITSLTSGIFAKNLAVYLVKNALKRPLADRISDLSRGDISKLAAFIKDCRFHITGSAPWKDSQSTLGGIHCSELDSALCSKREPGIYLCGEILDCAGDCGGFNLKWAWASGTTAGKSAAESLKGASR